MRKLFVGLTVLFALSNYAHAAERAVKCEIQTGSSKVFNGKCKFMQEDGGSFSLSNFSEKPLFDEVTIVSVTIVEKGIAEVRGLTTRGNNSRWGEAKRSTKDPACWVGSDFKICAR